MSINNLVPSANDTWPLDKPFIILDRVRKVFKTSAGESLVLKDIHTEIYKGEFVSVVGRSGSGKSTLANMITGIDHPSGGTIRVGDTVLNGMKESPMSIWRGKNLGIVFQFFQLLPMLTLVENVMLPMDFCNYHDPAEREQRALDLLDKVGLTEFAHQLPSAISGGQQQSTAIARALANDPPIIIADEPTGNLDSKTAETVMNLFEELAGQGKTILMVTHDNSLANRTSRKMVIADGELVDEALSQIFPEVDHSNLLEMDHLGVKFEFKQNHISPALPPDPFVMVITEGSLFLGISDRRGASPLCRGKCVQGPFPPEIKLMPGSDGIVSGRIFPYQKFLELSELPADQILKFPLPTTGPCREGWEI